MIQIQPSNPRWFFLVDRIESEIARDYTTRHDQDNDGIVERSEFSGNDDVFEQVDRNQNDRLELSEIKGYVDLLRQHEPIRNAEATRQDTQSEKGRSFLVSPYTTLTQGVRDYFSDEVGNLDSNANGFLESDEFPGTQQEFSLMDRDQNSLIGSREWAEGFVENHTEIQMVLESYRYSHGTFQRAGGIIQMAI
jgi:hypothetical protein